MWIFKFMKIIEILKFMFPLGERLRKSRCCRLDKVWCFEQWGANHRNILSSFDVHICKKQSIVWFRQDQSCKLGNRVSAMIFEYLSHLWFLGILVFLTLSRPVIILIPVYFYHCLLLEVHFSLVDVWLAPVPIWSLLIHFSNFQLLLLYHAVGTDVLLLVSYIWYAMHHFS